MKQFPGISSGNLSTILCFSLVLSTAVHAQTTIFSNLITGTNPNTANPYTSGQSVNANLSASGIGRGSGISGNAANNRYNASGFTTSSTLDANDYFEFGLTPAAGYNIDFTTFDYTGQSSAQGPSTFSFRSSLDGFTNDIGSPTATGTSISLAGSAFQNIITPITFRLYGYNASTGSGTFSVNDFTFNGAVNAIPLAIELTAFNATRRNLSADYLSWSTACNSTVRMFTIERSTGADAFTGIAKVKATSAVCNGTYKYSLEVPATTSGHNLYRLSMLDASGRLTYSPTIDLFNGGISNTNNIRLAPSPAKEVLNVSGLSEGDAWNVRDIQGRIVSSGALSASQINVSDLQAGTYFLQCARGKPIRFVKQ